MMKLDIKAIYEWPFTLQLLIVLPLCAFIFYFAYFFDFVSLNKSLQNSKLQENDLKQQVELIYKQQVKLNHELTKFPMLERMMSEWQAKLIQPSKLPDLLNDVLKIGTANGLKFDQLQPGDELKDGLYVKVPIKITAQGGYHQVAKFISQIAALPWLVVVKNIVLEKAKPQDAPDKNLAEQAALKNTLSIQMILGVYSMPGEFT